MAAEKQATSDAVRAASAAAAHTSGDADALVAAQQAKEGAEPKAHGAAKVEQDEMLPIQEKVFARVHFSFVPTECALTGAQNSTSAGSVSLRLCLCLARVRWVCAR